MISVKRTMPGPTELLEQQKKGSEGEYRLDSVLEYLMRDFSGKCYICESLEKSIAVEHLKPKSKFPELRCEWTNLFLACSYCNGIKSDEHYNILDCTNPEHLVEKWIEHKFEIDENLNGNVFFRASRENELVHNTIELLEKCFNYEKPKNSRAVNRVHGCLILHKQLARELSRFMHRLNQYETEKNPDIKSDLEKLYLSVESPFLSFKRTIIKNSACSQDFAHLFV